MLGQSRQCDGLSQIFLVHRGGLGNMPGPLSLGETKALEVLAFHFTLPAFPHGKTGPHSTVKLKRWEHEQLRYLVAKNLNLLAVQLSNLSEALGIAHHNRFPAGNNKAFFAPLRQDAADGEQGCARHLGQLLA